MWRIALWLVKYTPEGVSARLRCEKGWREMRHGEGKVKDENRDAVKCAAHWVLIRNAVLRFVLHGNLRLSSCSHVTHMATPRLDGCVAIVESGKP